MSMIYRAQQKKSSAEESPSNEKALPQQNSIGNKRKRSWLDERLASDSIC
jgi:hypothetical protein